MVSGFGIPIGGISNPESGIRISSVSGKRIVTDFTTLSIHFSNFSNISIMSLSYTGFMRICAYMINNSYYRAQMGPSKKPYSGEVTQAYEKQYKATCFESDGSQCVYFLNSFPNQRTFRIYVNRIVANAKILFENFNPDNTFEDDGVLGQYAHLMTLFETLRNNPVEVSSADQIPGIGLTNKAIDAYVNSAKSIESNACKRKMDLEREAKLSLIRELVSVGEVFLRAPRDQSDMTWQQSEAKQSASLAEAIDVEEKAITDSLAGRRALKKRKFEEKEDSKYKTAASMRIAQSVARDSSSSSMSPLPNVQDFSGVTEKLSYILNGKIDEAEAKVETNRSTKLQDAAFIAISNINNYKKDGKEWCKFLDNLGVDSAERMLTICQYEDDDIQASIHQMHNDLKLAPHIDFKKFLNTISH